MRTSAAITNVTYTTLSPVRLEFHSRTLLCQNHYNLSDNAASNFPFSILFAPFAAGFHRPPATCIDLLTLLIYYSEGRCRHLRPC